MHFLRDGCVSSVLKYPNSGAGSPHVFLYTFRFCARRFLVLTKISLFLNIIKASGVSPKHPHKNSSNSLFFKKVSVKESLEKLIFT